jgi:hypothetical protein
LFVHDVAGVEVGFEQRRCAPRAFQKTANITLNPLLERVAAIGVLSAYYKALDNRIDEGAGKALPSMLLKRAYKKAGKNLPETDRLYAEHYERLRGLEKEGCKRVDVVADCFAGMMKRAGREVLGGKYTDGAGEFLYHLGKWVYLADALDDLESDFKKKLYNPFLYAYNNFQSREQFVRDNSAGIRAAFYGSMNRMAEIFPELPLTQSQNLLRNIGIYGIRNKTDELLGAKSKLKRPRV